jgi:hypothetical protein
MKDKMESNLLRSMFEIVEIRNRYIYSMMIVMNTVE